MFDHGMTLNELTVAAMPMSLGAICLCGLGMWLWNSERELSKELTRTLFLGLSGMAVPHLVLHDAIPMLNRRTKYRTNFLVRGLQQMLSPLLGAPRVDLDSDNQKSIFG